MSVILKNWDSKFFQIKVGEIIIDSTENHVIDTFDFDLIYSSSSTQIELILFNYKNSYSEVQSVFEKENISNKFYTPKIFHLNQLSRINRNKLYELAFQSGKYSRFNLDERFTKKIFYDLYRKWIDNSISGDLADLFLVYLNGDQILGLLTCNIKEKRASIGLLAVDKKEQGKGIGGELIKYLENYLFEHGINQLRVTTQSQNLLAVKFYKKLHFKLATLKYINHFWKE